MSRRAHPYSGGAGSPRAACSATLPAGPLHALYPTAADHGGHRASPDPPPQSLMGQAALGQWAGWASGSAAASGSPRTFHRSPSSEGDAATSWAAFPDDRAFEDGASTLLAAAAEVDSASAAEAEAAVDAALAAGSAAAGAATSVPARADGSGSNGSATLAQTAPAAAMPFVAAAGSPMAPHTPTQTASLQVPPVTGVPTTAVHAWALALSRSPGACQVVGAAQELMLRTLLAALQQGSSQGAP